MKSTRSSAVAAYEKSYDTSTSRTSNRSSTNSTNSRSSSRLSSTELRDVVVEAADAHKRLVRQRQSSMTLSTLRLSDMKLHGRDDDIKLLCSKLDSILDIKRELILVAGSPGVGKSYLVTKGLKEPAEKRGIVFASGKFDLNSYSLPYSAFAQALCALAKQVMSSSNAFKIKLDIHDALGTEDMQVIATALPGCELFFSFEGGPTCLARRRRSSAGSMGSSVNSENEIGLTISSNGKEAINRMNYAVRRLMKAVCSNLQGCCIFIDDIQWSDSSSLNLLQSLLQDEDIPSLLLVGAYRNEEVSNSHPLALSVKEVERLGCDITTITLNNLEAQYVQTLVAEALNMSDEVQYVKTLADVIYTKTKGCPFFVILFLRSIYDDGLLKYSFVVERWTWDDQKVREKYVTDNVAMSMNLKKIKPRGQEVLKFAACLGHSFSTEVLELVLDHSLTYREDSDDESLADVLADFEYEGLLEEKDYKCRFSHDLIQLSALEMIPPNEIEAFKGDVGAILLNHLPSNLLDDYLFAAVSLRNCATVLSDSERAELIQLNLKAGITASSNAAFDTAVVYLEAARNLLGQPTSDAFDNTSVQIYNAEARARFIIGDMDAANNLLDELLSRSKTLSMIDKFKAFEVKILIAQSLSNFDKAISLALELREQLRFKPIPTNVSNIAIIREYMKTTFAFKNRTQDDLAALPYATDERVMIGQQLLELIMPSVYQANPNMFVLVTLCSARDALKHGINSCVPLVGYAILLCGIFGKYEQGAEIGRAAELTMERPGMRDTRSLTRYNCDGFISHWTAPLKRTLQPLLEGYIIGLETGDTESAGWNICLRCCYSWFASRPISDLVSEIKPIIDVFDQLNFAAAKNCTLPFLQAAHNLSGTDNGVVSPWLLSSQVGYDTFQFALENSNKMVRAYTTVVQLDMFVFFHQWGDATDLLVRSEDLRLVVIGLFHVVRFTFLEAFISLKVAQLESGWRVRRKWKARAKRAMKIMRKWLKHGNVNCVHTYHLLVAEYNALIGKNIEAEESFRLAQTSAGRCGCLQDRALSYEMAALFYIGRGDDKRASDQFMLAHRSYQDWGAVAKTSHIESEFSQYFKDV